MKLEKLANPFLPVSGAMESLLVTSITANSSDVTAGSVFFGLPGSRTDGASFVADAAQAGAIAAVVSTDSEIDNAGLPVIRSNNPRAALAHTAALFFDNQPETMAAVTGTAGKTSVATFLRQIWEMDGKAAASLGTTGVVAPGRDDYGNLTTPDPVSLHSLLAELADDGVTHASMEASSHGLDQHRLDGVRLAAAGFTNLGRDHMDYHPTVEAYLDAKLRLFRDLLEPGAPAVIFSDDPFSEAAIEAAREHGCDVRTVGRKGDFITLKKVEHLQFSQSVELQHRDSHHIINFPLAGDFQIANGLVAAGLAISTGVDPDKTFRALEKLKGASGRLELVGRMENGAPAYVDYAHKPDALENVLQSLRPFCTGRIVVVFGCGGDRDAGKRPLMGEIAERLSDIAIVTDDNPRSEDPASIRAEIMAACKSGIEIADRAEAIHHACSLLQEGDCVVVAGKGHEPGQIVGDKVLPFSDHEVLRNAISGKAT